MGYETQIESQCFSIIVGENIGIIVTVLNVNIHFSPHPSEDIEYFFSPFKNTALS